MASWPWAAVADDRQPEGKPCALAIKLVDADSGATLPGIVRIRGAAGQNVPIAELVNRGQGVEDEGPIHDWWVLAEPRTIALPRQRLTVEALAGLDTERAVRNLDLQGASGPRSPSPWRASTGKTAAGIARVIPTCTCAN